MVDVTNDIIDLNIDTISTIELNPSSFQSRPSVNFGSGIELLMNDKRLNDGKKSSKLDINLEDLNKLEDELNDLIEEPKSTPAISKSGLFNSSFFGGESIKLNTFNITPDADTANNQNDNVSIGSIVSVSNIGKATASSSSNANTKTWDGFTKFNNVPINPDKNMSYNAKLSPEEILVAKFKVLRNLEELERKGVKLTKNYSMESSLTEMEGEYEMIISEKERKNSCKFQGKMLMAAITGIEYLNNRFDPFDVKLEGWGEQINENIEDYDEIFAELHEKYKSKAKMSPELKLLFQLGGSAIMVHMTNTMFKSTMPGMDDIMKQNPELMQQFTSAAVNSMQNSNPGFSGFMGNFIPGSSNNRPPPQPMPTQTNRSQNERTAPPTNRPDLMRARNDDGINIQEQFASYDTKETGEKTMRPEMKGPTDISDILSGLKTMSVKTASPMKIINPTTIKDQIPIKKSSSGKTPRKQKSDKNIVSLDI